MCRLRVMSGAQDKYVWPPFPGRVCRMRLQVGLFYSVGVHRRACEWVEDNGAYPPTRRHVCIFVATRACLSEILVPESVLPTSARFTSICRPNRSSPWPLFVSETCPRAAA